MRVAPLVRSRTCAFALASVLAATLAYDLWRMPIQVADALGEIVDAQQSPSIMSSFTRNFGSTAYLRPLRIAQIKALFDASHGNYRFAYRGSHALLLVALLLLFAGALRVESGRDLAAAAFALTALTGLHTFLGFVREAFPINHFLEIAVLCLAMLTLTQSRGGWWVDVAACLLFVAGALTLESGLLVWVVVAAAWLCGLRGVSRGGVAAVTVLLIGYLAWRFQYLDTGLPGLDERSSGFMLERLEPEELQRRFGQAPLMFYAYNVAASVLSVLASEPRDGLFVFARSWIDGDVRPREYVAVISSAATTAMIGWWAVTRWRARAFRVPSDRVAVVGGIVLLVNGVLSFAYTKDDIVAVGGVFYALAAFVAVREVIERSSTLHRSAVVVTLVLFVLSSRWAVRSLGIHHVLAAQAFRVRNDWVEAPAVLRSENRWPQQPAGVELVETLRTQAIESPVANIELVPEWRNRWFGD